MCRGVKRGSHLHLLWASSSIKILPFSSNLTEFIHLLFISTSVHDHKTWNFHAGLQYRSYFLDSRQTWCNSSKCSDSILFAVCAVRLWAPQVKIVEMCHHSHTNICLYFVFSGNGNTILIQRSSNVSIVGGSVELLWFFLVCLCQLQVNQHTNKYLLFRSDIYDRSCFH